MKDQEEREQNGEVTPTAEVSPVKSGDEGVTLERADEPDSTATEEPTGRATSEDPELDLMEPGGSSEGKDSQANDTAQGALGQVKAKVEVCKDESVGKRLRFHILLCISLKSTWFLNPLFLCLLPQTLKSLEATWRSALILSK